MLKKGSESVWSVNKDYITIKYTWWQTTDEPRFVSNDWVETNSTSWKIKSFYWNHTTTWKWVKSITVVLVDEDWDEQHINWSMWFATKDLWNGLLWNIWLNVTIVWYLNNKWYTSFTVKKDWEHTSTVLDYDKIGINEINSFWDYVAQKYWYWLNDWKDRKFINATNPNAEIWKKTWTQSEDNWEEISIEDLPF